MTKASSAPAAATIDPEEARRFAAMAADWWDPRGSSAMLHRLNPVRLAFLREQVDRHWSLEPGSRSPLAGRSALDVGCGAGLLAEPLARLGATVTGLDAAAEVIAVARAHAAGQRLAIDYRVGELDTVEDRFDLVTCLEVLEHVADPAAFVAALGRRLAPGGLLILSTPNRTARARLLVVTLAEGTGTIPRGTHDADRFVTPDELGLMLDRAGLTELDRRGLAPTLSRGFTLSDDLRMNYLIAARPATGR